MVKVRIIFVKTALKLKFIHVATVKLFLVLCSCQTGDILGQENRGLTWLAVLIGQPIKFDIAIVRRHWLTIDDVTDWTGLLLLMLYNVLYISVANHNATGAQFSQVLRTWNHWFLWNH